MSFQFLFIECISCIECYVGLYMTAYSIHIYLRVGVIPISKKKSGGKSSVAKVCIVNAKLPPSYPKDVVHKMCWVLIIYYHVVFIFILIILNYYSLLFLLYLNYYFKIFGILRWVSWVKLGG